MVRTPKSFQSSWNDFRTSESGIVLNEEKGTITRWWVQKRPLSGVRAHIELGGGHVRQRLTLTRIVFLPLAGVFAPKKYDERLVLLVINGPDFHWTVQVPASRVGDYKQLAFRINQASERQEESA
jgi:hypothetical protein